MPPLVAIGDAIATSRGIEWKSNEMLKEGEEKREERKKTKEFKEQKERLLE